MEDLIDRYKLINSSFKKVAIAHVGINAGFFSEYKCLINIVLYCWENNIQFKLYSKDANFGYQDGWSDYFMPFCEEVTDSFHHYCNFHSLHSLKNIWYLRKEIEAPTLRWKIKLDILNLIGKMIKLKKGFDYYTQDISSQMPPLIRNYNISSIDFKGNYFEAYSLANTLIWNFTDEIKTQIEELKSNLGLPREYVSCQIRGGDKIIEYSLYSVDLYIDKLAKISNIKNVFVLTDDYQILQDLKNKAPDYNWYSFCGVEEKGYYNKTFMKTTSCMKKEKMIRFFASIEIMQESNLFLGTITSGPSLHIANLKYPNVYFVDADASIYLKSIGQKREYRRSLIEGSKL